MNRKLIIRLQGAILWIEAMAMIPSLLISLYYQDGDFPILGLSFVLLLIPGMLVWFFVKSNPSTHLRLKEGFIIVALGWLILSLGGALPFLFSGLYSTFADAIFESVSGFTTTGATVLTQYEGYPRGLMFWRASTHWIGGMGVLVLTLALLPKLTGRTSHLVRAESPGPSLSKLVPHTGTTAKILYSLYFLLTLTEFLALLLCGLSPYDAALHAISNAGTGGFSNYGDSIASFQNPAAEAGITLLMFLFGVNFALYYRFLIAGPWKRILTFFQDEEFRWYIGLTFGFITVLTLLNLSFYQGNILSSATARLKSVPSFRPPDLRPQILTTGLPPRRCWYSSPCGLAHAQAQQPAGSSLSGLFCLEKPACVPYGQQDSPRRCRLYGWMARQLMKAC